MQLPFYARRDISVVFTLSIPYDIPTMGKK